MSKTTSLINVKKQVIGKDVDLGPDAFKMVVGRTTWECWRGTDGRWYGHEKKSGRIVNAFSYASRRSARRAIKRFILEKNLVAA